MLSYSHKKGIPERSLPGSELSIVDGQVRALFGNAEIACSQRVTEYRQKYSPPVFFPSEDVKLELLHLTAYTTCCPEKGEAFCFNNKN